MTKTNDQVVRRLMARSSSGPMMQVFIIQALDQYAKQVAQAPAGYMEGSMVSEAVWRACAEEIVRTLDDHLSRAPSACLADNP